MVCYALSCAYRRRFSILERLTVEGSTAVDMNIDKELKAALNTEVHTVSISDIATLPELQMRDVMTSNYKNGQQPSNSDRKRSVEMICEHYAAEIGLDSTKVVKIVVEMGVPKRTADRYTKELRAKLDNKRDQKIAEMLEAGVSQRKIAETVGCSKTTVVNIQKAVEASGQNAPLAQNDHPESPTAPSDDTTAPPTSTNDIDLDDLDDDNMEEALEQQAAFQKAHEEHEQNRRKRASNASSTPDKPSRLELLKMLVTESRDAKPYSVVEMEELRKIINAVGF